MLTLLSDPQLSQDDWERVLQFLPENSPIEPGIPGIQLVYREFCDDSKTVDSKMHFDINIKIKLIYLRNKNDVY
jgi:hypothetical protein